MSFQAIVARQNYNKVTAAVETMQDEFLTAGEVAVAVEWSTVNYKDAVALAGQNIIQKFPLIPEIDFAGTVENSVDRGFRPGDKIASNMLAGQSRGRTLIDVNR